MLKNFLFFDSDDDTFSRKILINMSQIKMILGTSEGLHSTIYLSDNTDITVRENIFSIYCNFFQKMDILFLDLKLNDFIFFDKIIIPVSLIKTIQEDDLTGLTIVFLCDGTRFKVYDSITTILNK